MAPAATAPAAAEPRTAFDGRSLEAVAAERPPVICSHCREAIVHDGEQWWHVRTGLSAHWRHMECRPLCRDCGQPATRAIGGDQFVGSGIKFVIDHFACDEHAKGQGPFVRT